MSTAVMDALIGAIATIGAALIAVLIKRRNAHGEPQGTQIGNVSAGHNAVVAGRDAVVIQTEDSRFISKNGAALIIAVSKEILTDEDVRQRWSSFDVKFLMKCLKDTPRGMTFDGESFQEFRKQENDEMFGMGVRVYTACCRRVGESSPDYPAFNKIAQVYLNARMVLRQAG